MRFTFTFLTFLLITHFGWAQTVIFHDTFDQDKNKWSYSGDGFESKIESSKFNDCISAFTSIEKLFSSFIY